MKSFSIKHKGKELCFYTVGKGSPLLLIHGYLADSRIWGIFADDLAENYELILIDLPGHGKSELSAQKNGMDLLADAVLAVIQHLRYSVVSILGHSMGGYVALAFLENYPEYIQEIILLNSHPWKDDPDKIVLRKKEIYLMESGKKEMLIKFNIANSYSKYHTERLSASILNLEKIALSQTVEGITSMLKGMMIREDRTQVLLSSTAPVCIILGKDDERIDLQRVQNTFSGYTHISIHILDRVGHMSMLEAKDLTVNLIKQLLQTNKF